MTPAERDEVRRIAQETIDTHDRCVDSLAPCWSCTQAAAVLRYVPAGDASDPGVASEWVAAFPHKARRLAHALHAAADAAEET